MIKLTDIINELEINSPHIFRIAAKELCSLSLGIEFCYEGDDPNIINILEKFDIPNDDTDYIYMKDIEYPIESFEDLKIKILKMKLKDN